MGIDAIIKAVESFFSKRFSKPCKVITVKKEGEEWIALMETVVDDDVARRYARTPIVGLWEAHLDSGYNVTSFERKGLKEATDLHYEEKGE